MDSIQELRQQQLINEILSKNTSQNNQSVIDAYVQATTESKSKSVEDIEKRKADILKAKAFDQKRQNRRQIEEAKNLLSNIDKLVEKNSDIDARLAEMNKNEELEKRAREEQVNKILNELNTKKRKIKTPMERVEAIERENFRRRYTDTMAKKSNMYKQMELLAKKNNTEKLKQEIEKREKQKKVTLFDRIKNSFFKNSRNKVTPFANNKTVITEQSKKSKVVHTYSNLPAKKYENTMDIYQNGKVSPTGRNFDVRIGTNGILNGISNNKTFLNTIQQRYAIDHNKANNDAMKKVANGKFYDPKTATR